MWTSIIVQCTLYVFSFGVLCDSSDYFQGFLCRFEVSNYPLKQRSRSEQEQYERVLMKRKIELAELEVS